MGFKGVQVSRGKQPWRAAALHRLVAAICLAAAGGGPAQAGQVFTHWTMPVIPVPELERPSGPDVFGTIALPIRARPTSTRWAKVMRASLDQPMLDRITAPARMLTPEASLAHVQRTVNRAIRTGTMSTNCTDDGYWAPAQETLARGMGDCFDVAIAKMEALRRLGIPGKDMYLTTGWFRRGFADGKGRESVALLVRVGDHFWLMPEDHDEAVAARDETGAALQFTPVVTYGVGMTWVHGRIMRVAALEASARPAAPAIARSGQTVAGPVRR